MIINHSYVDEVYSVFILWIQLMTLWGFKFYLITNEMMEWNKETDHQIWQWYMCCMLYIYIHKNLWHSTLFSIIFFVFVIHSFWIFRTPIFKMREKYQHDIAFGVHTSDQLILINFIRFYLTRSGIESGIESGIGYQGSQNPRTWSYSMNFTCIVC